MTLAAVACSLDDKPEEPTSTGELGLASPLRVQAETGTISGTGIGVRTDVAGYEGTGFVGNFTANGDKVTLSFPGVDAGTYEVRIRYQAWTAQQNYISIDGGANQDVSFPATGSAWATVTLTGVSLVNGTNTVAVLKDWGYMGVDYIEIAGGGTSSYPTAAAADTPAGYWRFEETTGTVADDSSGDGRNGTYLGGVSFGQTGALADTTNKAALFDGVNGRVEVPDSSALRLNGSFSIEFFAKSSGSVVNTWPGIVSKGNAGSGGTSYLIYYTSAQRPTFKRADIDGCQVSTSAQLVTTGYKHYVLTYDATTHIPRWYVNGALDTTCAAATYPSNTDASVLAIGRADVYGKTYLDEFAVYPTALSASRVQSHFQAASTVSTPDLVVTDIAWSPSAPTSGNAVTFSVTIMNQGSGATPSNTIHSVSFSVDGTQVSWSDNSTASLAPGATRTVTANSGPGGSSTWTATAGTHTIQAWVDDVNRIAESNENNNTLTESLSVGTSGPQIGTNTHTGGGSTSANTQFASVMANRNLRVARLDYIVNSDMTLPRDQITKINANGGSAQLVVQNSYQWDGSCSTNLSAVETSSYNQTSQMVTAMKDIVHDFEVFNEAQLFQWFTNEVPWNSAGTSTTPYQGKPCVASVMAATRGAARAIRDQGQRAIVGVIGKDFGWLYFLQQNNVVWDVTGYHIYPHYGDASLASDPWFGTNGPLYQLSLLGKAITINEFNCGEIYDSDYENTAGQPKTEACLSSVNKHLMEIRNWSGSQPIQSVVTYEFLDEPSKAAPENRFGLLYTITNPKIELYLVTAYAGGNLTSTEQSTITSRGLLTDAQIAAMK